MFERVLLTAVGCAGALLMLEALFWLHAAVTGTALDGLDPNYPGHIVCLNPPLPAVFLEIAVASALLMFSFKLYRSHSRDRITMARENVRQLRSKAQLSDWH